MSRSVSICGHKPKTCRSFHFISGFSRKHDSVTLASLFVAPGFSIFVSRRRLNVGSGVQGVNREPEALGWDPFLRYL